MAAVTSGPGGQGPPADPAAGVPPCAGAPGTDEPGEGAPASEGPAPNDPAPAAPGADGRDTDGPASAAPAAAVLLARRYERFGALCAVFVTGAWHLGFDLVGVITAGPVRAGPWSSVACWTAYTVAAAAFSVRLLRTPAPAWGPSPPRDPDSARSAPSPLWSRTWAWNGAGLALALSLTVLLICPPGQEITPADWGWGSVGWLAMLALWHRPLSELILFVVANAVTMLAVLTARGTADRQTLAAWLTVVVSSGTLQWGLGLVARMLVVTSTEVSRRAEELSREDVRRARERTVRATRARLAASIHADAHPLVCRLAAGAPPEDEALRHRCAVSAARIRRLVLHTRGSRDPLADELGAAADIAASRGVVVDLDVHGQLPVLPPADLQALTEAPLRALAAARHCARVTVAAFDGRVVVGVLSDAGEIDAPAPDPAAAVRLDVHRIDSGRQTWIESSWAPSPSP